jgi:radical SAM superfamily enzyme YgiQ (UPF0313 family)
MGFPDEDLESINKTLNAPSELGLDFASFYIVQPYPGTRLYPVFQKEGLLNPDEKEASSGLYSTYNTKHFTSEELVRLQQLAYKKFIRRRIKRAINPINIKQILFKINSPEKFLYFLRLINNLLLGIWMGRAAPAPLSERIAQRWSQLRQGTPEK